MIFAEVESDSSDYFDWKYAREKCVPHSDGSVRHSVYLAIYRVLEHMPLTAIKKIYLVTQDGRSLGIEPSQYPPSEKMDQPFYMYQELCPVRPIVVSRLAPDGFSKHLTNGESKISLPTVAFADFKIIDFKNLEESGHVGSYYYRNLDHLQACVEAVTRNPKKISKTLDRSQVSHFSYQVIDWGIYIGSLSEMLFFPFPSKETLVENHYDWALSAMII